MDATFKCPKCGSPHFGRDTSKTLDGVVVVLHTVRCHGSQPKPNGCDWRGIWPPARKTKDTTMETQTQNLETALESLRNVDTYAIAKEFEKQLLTRTGLWIGMRLDPLTGAWHASCETSATTSCDEYFQESGLLSEMTVCSGSTHGTPGPDDGYEWENSDDGEYWGNDSGDHCTDDDLESFLEEYFSEEYDALPGGNDLRELAVSVGLYRFTVGTTPVSPDYEYRMKSIQELIDERIAAIESELV